MDPVTMLEIAGAPGVVVAHQNFRLLDDSQGNNDLFQRPLLRIRHPALPDFLHRVKEQHMAKMVKACEGANKFPMRRGNNLHMSV
jgi:hypothetical protein